MKKPALITVCALGLLVMALSGWGLIGSTERSPELLTGELWSTMSPDAKVAYVWGIGNLVELERAQTGQQAGNKSFIPFLAKGLAGKTMNEVVREVDLYYQNHPDQLKRPVVDAIFQAVVLPALRAER